MVVPLLHRASRRYLKRHLWQTSLTIVGIMLGVSMVVAVDLANNSASRAFALSLETVAGPTSHQIIGGPLGIDEQVYVRLRTELGLQQSAPIVTDVVRINGGHFTLIGIDPVTELQRQRHRIPAPTNRDFNWLLQANTLAISHRSAEGLAVVVGDSLLMDYRGRQHTVQIATIFHSDNPAATDGLLFADISVAQELLQRHQRLDRIDLRLSGDQATALQAWLPQDLQLVESPSRNQSAQHLSEAFHINLSAMSLLALLVGALLIYNSLTLSVLQRRNSIGIYRSLGVTRNEVFRLILAEALGLGLIGTLAGLVLGLLLGQFLVHLVTRTINDLYFLINVRDFFISPESILKGALLGLVTTALAAMFPAWEATRTHPVTVQQRSALEQRWRRRMPQLLAASLPMLVLGYLLLNQSGQSLVSGFIALTLILFGFALSIPALLLLIGPLLMAVIAPWSGTIGRMAVRGISACISRTGLATAALAVTVSATIGVGIMITSFRDTVGLWLEQSLSGDLYISLPGRYARTASPGLPLRLVDDLKQFPGLVGASTTRAILAETEFGPLRLLAFESSNQVHRNFALKQGQPDARKAFVEGRGILISEPLAYHRNLVPGDQLSIHTDKGSIPLPVLGVFYDYSSSRGLIALHRSLYDQLWQDPRVSGITLYRHPDTSQQLLLKNIRLRLAREPMAIQVISNRELRNISLAIFDRTFAITHVLKLLTVLVAFIGVLSALMSIQLERQREFAILRACGATPAEISGLILGQTLLMGLLAGLLAIPLGMVMANILIDVINQRAFGWSMQHSLPIGVLWQALLLAIAAALLAGIYPAYRAATITTARALREE